MVTFENGSHCCWPSLPCGLLEFLHLSFLIFAFFSFIINLFNPILVEYTHLMRFIPQPKDFVISSYPIIAQFVYSRTNKTLLILFFYFFEPKKGTCSLHEDRCSEVVMMMNRILSRQSLIEEDETTLSHWCKKTSETAIIITSPEISIFVQKATSTCRVITT